MGSGRPLITGRKAVGRMCSSNPVISLELKAEAILDSLSSTECGTAAVD